MGVLSSEVCVKDGVIAQDSYIKSKLKVMLVPKDLNDTVDGGN